MKRILPIIVALFIHTELTAQQQSTFAGKPLKSATAQTATFPFSTQRGTMLGAYMGNLVLNNPAWEMTRDKNTGLPIAIDGIKINSFNGDFSSLKTTLYISEAFSLLQPYLKLKEGNKDMVILLQEIDEYGNQHIKFQQTINGVNIYGAQAWLHFQQDGTIYFNGRTVPTPSINTQALFSQQAAEKLVQSDMERKFTFSEAGLRVQKELKIARFETKKVVMSNDKNTNAMHLVWHISVRPNILHHWEYFVDAHTGEILKKFDHTCTVGPTTTNANDLNGVIRAVNAFNANGTHYLINASKSMYTGPNTAKPADGSGIITTLDLQNTNLNNPSYVEITSTNNNTWSSKAVSAHYNASASFDYFKSKFNRNSIDGKGGDVVSFINVADDNGGGFDNAFWNGKYMFYGNGATDFKPLPGGLDVGGHEMTHGVIQNTAGLEYNGESGAINESMADVFGVLIEGQNYLIGEEVVKLSAFPSGALRNMQDPHNGGSSLSSPGYQPAHVNEQYSGTQDNGGVHINSGIPNKAFYLIASTITKAKAEQIYYKALSLYLTKSSKFIDLRLAVVKAASDIHGATSTEVNTVKQSFDAVGILDGNGGNYQPTLPSNPGAERMLIVNTDVADNNTLYLTTSAASTFQPLSQVPLNRKASVTDDGSAAFFVGTDNNIYSVLLASPFTQTKLTTDNFFDNVAVSKDGNNLAAISKFADTSIYVYSSSLNQWRKFQLYIPTTAQGVRSGGVLYADVLEWDVSGKYVMYDSYNEINGSGGQKLSFWDIGVIEVWNSSSFGSGNIQKIFNQIDQGESVGNPTFSKNSPYIVAFDYINSNTNQNLILGINLETGDIQTIFDNGMLGTPSYSPLDNKVAFSAINTNSVPVVGVIDLATNKIGGISSSAIIIVNEAKWPVWFATGNRALGVDKLTENIVVDIYPNPTNSILFIASDTKMSTIEVYDLVGKKMNINTDLDEKSIDVSMLSAGTYLVRMVSKNGNATRRFIKM